MIKYFKLTILYIVAICILSLTGCTNEVKGTEKAKGPIKAIYLAPKNGGQLSKKELEKYPEVVSVSSLNELKQLVSKKTAIWIDKDVVDLLDESWISHEVQNHIPIALIGYNDTLYSFREKIPVFGIKGPYIDWSKRRLEPGYSIAIIKDNNNTSTSGFLKGYDTTPDVEQILSKTNMLLEGKFPD